MSKEIIIRNSWVEFLTIKFRVFISTRTATKRDRKTYE